ncbi:hypothetical protein MXMO3_01758 [Maritalea myrionectae]|uniref:Uncharacterized protein n=1 Tax=Maritalea myrionectae TaxID=454601 RepID=A0A2R4ME85_9HYPH|nr:hypothetical protein [Maritalea myrionectae]AVX04283.1 hypothetical protein MXMO3_01758 [Maritalea myrionectae]
MNDQVNMDELARKVAQAQHHADLNYHNSLSAELEDANKKEIDLQRSLDENVSECRRLNEIIKRAQTAIDSRQRQAGFDRASLKSLRRHIATMKDEIDRANGELQ